MPVIIPAGTESTSTRLIIYLITVAIIVLVAYIVYWYVIRPIIDGRLLPGSNVPCTTISPAVTDLTGNSSGNRVYLKWSPTVRTDSYVVYMGITSSFNTALAERVIPVKGDSVAVLNLLPVTYYFKVESINSCGKSSLSNEISVLVTQYPHRYKICKTNVPTLCLLMQNEGAINRLSAQCPNTQCEFSRPTSQQIRAADDSICLAENDFLNSGGATVQTFTYCRQCSDPTAVKWNYDIVSRRIISEDGLALGADSIANSLVYNTTNTSISNANDGRYAWTIQPITN